MYATDSSPINQQDFNNLKREYTLAQVRYWLLAKKAKDVCNRDIISVLYFYSSQNTCQQCNNQGFILTYAKKMFGDSLLIFSFDSGFKEEPLIDLMLKTYNISSYPSLVIGDKKYGFTDTNQLIGILCSDYQNNTNCPVNNSTSEGVNESANVTNSSLLAEKINAALNNAS